MDKIKQRIAIAEACGIKIPDWVKSANITDWWDGPDYTNPRQIADYTGDLNAMHEARAMALVSKMGVEMYEQILSEICNGFRNAIHATAEQRAEAFLKAHNIWTE